MKCISIPGIHCTSILSRFRKLMDTLSGKATSSVCLVASLINRSGWSGGVMMLGKLLVPGRPTNLDQSRARAYCACSGCGLFGHFFSCLSFLFSLSLSLGDGPI